uniref:Uncharacterized protein n=1 Tax=Leersia perrieri TaxID=77586 RepID=A0A0D9WGC3_9ORYZ
MARFQIWYGLEAPFVSAGPDWKRARFGLGTPIPGLDAIRTSHPPASFQMGRARRRRRGWRHGRRRGRRREETARRLTEGDGDGNLRCLLAGLFLPAVVRPMLDSWETAKQVPPPAPANLPGWKLDLPNKAQELEHGADEERRRSGISRN